MMQGMDFTPKPNACSYFAQTEWKGEREREREREKERERERERILTY